MRDLAKLELLLLRLPERVGSPLSIQAMSEDLGVAHRTVAEWLDLLERLALIYRVPPLDGPSLRAVKKAAKHYHWIWSLPREPAQRFENLVASHLLKWMHFEQDVRGRDLELRYFRDRTGREVYLVVTESGPPISLVECRLRDEPVHRPLLWLKRRFPEADAWQLSARGRKDYVTGSGRIVRGRYRADRSAAELAENTKDTATEEAAFRFRPPRSGVSTVPCRRPLEVHRRVRLGGHACLPPSSAGFRGGFLLTCSALSCSD